MKRLIALALLPAAALSLAACGGSKPNAAPTTAVARFWSTPSGQLHPDLSTYCGILRSTLAAKDSPLTGTSTGDPKVVATVTAWVGDLQATAPAPVHAAWQTEGPALIQLSGGKPGGLDTAAMTRAADQIAAHAKAACGVDLAATSAMPSGTTPSRTTPSRTTG